MVNAFALSAAFVAASFATVAQAAILKQSPYFGCVSFTNGTLGLANPDDSGAVDGDVTPVNFLAGYEVKSLVTGEKKNSILATTTRTGKAVTGGDFEFINCTQSLIQRGYDLYVPKSFTELADDDTTYTYMWGTVRHQGSSRHALSVREAPDSKGRLDDISVLHTMVAETPIEDRTFVLATADDGTTNFIEFYPFHGKGKKAKSGVFYHSDNKYGTVRVSTKHAAHAGTAYLAITDGTTA